VIPVMPMIIGRPPRPPASRLLVIVAEMVGILQMFVTMAACGSERDNAEEVCTEISQTHCRRLFECLSDDEIRQLGFSTPLEECISVRVSECKGMTLDTACDGDGVYDREAAALCLQQTRTLECRFAVNNNTRLSCFRICTGDPDEDGNADF
jgi:hypothetical protein